jgi:hypothetical protein
MPETPYSFRESNLFGSPIRDLELSIEDTRLAPVIEEFRAELAAVGLTKISPSFYLSTEWGVAFGTVAVGIPFYLARPELTELHGEEVGHIEGFNKADILRYLRHEMGHVVNYAYKLYDDEAWVKLFGSITQPYREEYRPQPFSRRFVRHLPGWYAQKHPDEDWSETFAVWMTPGRDWGADYGQLPTALAKLEYCDQKMKELAAREPLVTALERDEDVSGMFMSLEDFYNTYPAEAEPGAAGLDGDLRAIFADLGDPEGEGTGTDVKPAAALIRRLERQLMADVFRWTGHFPEKTRSLMRALAKRAEALKQVYQPDDEAQAIVGVTILVTSLAMNFVHRGAYFPEAPSQATAQLEKLSQSDSKQDKRDADAQPEAKTAERPPAGNGELDAAEPDAADPQSTDLPERPTEAAGAARDREPTRGTAKD